MVMRQKTKPIKVGRGRGGRGRGRGRGGRGRGHFRGGYMSARGAGHFTTRGTGHTYYRGTGHMLARGTSHMSSRAAGHFSARGNGPEPARGPGFGGNQSYGFSGDLKQHSQNDKFQYSQYKKELPPRFMKANADRSQGNNADKVLVFQKTSSVVHDIKTKNASQGYIEEKAVVHTIESQNWEVPENGEEYLLAFKDYFVSRGEEPPPIEIVEGKVSKQNGFYGRLRYNGLMYYPLVILHTRQHAEWMAAKAFCTQNNITLPVPSVEPQSPDKQVHHSEIQPSKSVVLSPVIVQSHSDHIQFNSPQPSNSVIQTPVSSLTEQENMDIVHKLYMMLKDKEFGVFLKYLEVNFNFSSFHSRLPNRFIVYTVPDALNKPKACSASTEVMRMDYPRVPPCHLPKVGDVVKGTIVFVYSPDEFYFRDINTEDTMQALEEMLNTIYSKADVPDVKSLAVNSFVIGQYLEGWYRAQVKKIDEKGHLLRVSIVYIADYYDLIEDTENMLN
uniref:Tudor domain-containing protein n=1 Tax=Biomphalaria glabrata TaxID=6526 RepID=A0A2C9LHU6_BIOGL